MENYHEFIPLGYARNVPAIFSIRERRGKTGLFDYIQTPMWAVHELFTNNFDQLFDKTNLVSEPQFDADPTKYLTDTRYNIRFGAKEVPTTFEHMQYEDVLIKGKNRMLACIADAEANAKKVLFIRCEEPMNDPQRGQRIVRPEHSAKYANSELYYLQFLAEHIAAEYPALDFGILFLNSNGHFTDPEHHIVGIPLSDCDLGDMRIFRKMHNHIADHNTFLANNL